MSTEKFSSMKAPERDGTLDSIRALLISAVLFYHYLVRWAPPHHVNDLYHYSEKYPEIFEIGKFGVHLFFMLSGIFITTTLMKSKNSFDFVYRRIRRIYPPFVVCCTITFGMLIFAPPDFQVSLKDYFLSLIFISDNVGGRLVDGAYWSLVVEIKFYFWIALAHIVFRDRFWVGILLVVFAGALASLISYKVAKEVFLLPYMPMFLAGIALGYRGTGRGTTPALILACVAAILLASQVSAFTLQGTPSTLATAIVAASMIALALIVEFKIRLPVGRILPYIGVISYEIYLIHQKIGVSIIGWLRQSSGMPDLLAAAVATSLVVLIAVGVHLSVKAVFFRSRKPVLHPAN